MLLKKSEKYFATLKGPTGQFTNLTVEVCYDPEFSEDLVIRIKLGEGRKENEEVLCIENKFFKGFIEALKEVEERVKIFG